MSLGEAEDVLQGCATALLVANRVSMGLKTRSLLHRLVNATKVCDFK